MYITIFCVPFFRFRNQNLQVFTWVNISHHIRIGITCTHYKCLLYTIISPPLQITFPTIESYTGYCVHKGISLSFTKRECVKRPEHEYVSFDISGHSFLLVYCIMIIMEESKEMLYFLQLSRHFRGAPPLEGNETLVPGKEVKNLEKVFKIMSPLIVLAFLAMVAICLLWDFMLIITSIYYHSLLEKLLGTVLSLGMWYILYKRIFIVLREIL